MTDSGKNKNNLSYCRQYVSELICSIPSNRIFCTFGNRYKRSYSVNASGNDFFNISNIKKVKINTKVHFVSLLHT